MGRIKIEDLPRDMKISKKEMRKVVGGLSFSLAQSYPKQTLYANLSSGAIVAPFIPGGAVLSSAISGLGQLKDPVGD